MVWLKAAADGEDALWERGQTRWDAPRINTEQTSIAAIPNWASFIIVKDMVIPRDCLNLTAPFQLLPRSFGYGAIPLPSLQRG